MANFREKIGKAIGESKVFNATANFLSDKQKEFQSKQTVEQLEKKLHELFDELGRTIYYQQVLVAGRTSPAIKQDITEVLKAIDELKNPKVDGEVVD